MAALHTLDIFYQHLVLSLCMIPPEQSYNYETVKSQI